MKRIPRILLILLLLAGWPAAVLALDPAPPGLTVVSEVDLDPFQAVRIRCRYPHFIALIEEGPSEPFTMLATCGWSPPQRVLYLPLLAQH